MKKIILILAFMLCCSSASADGTKVFLGYVFDKMGGSVLIGSSFFASYIGSESSLTFDLMASRNDSKSYQMYYAGATIGSVSNKMINVFAQAGLANFVFDKSYNDHSSLNASFGVGLRVDFSKKIGSDFKVIELINSSGADLSNPFIVFTINFSI